MGHLQVIPHEESSGVLLLELGTFLGLGRTMTQKPLPGLLLGYV